MIAEASRSPVRTRPAGGLGAMLSRRHAGQSWSPQPNRRAAVRDRAPHANDAASSARHVFGPLGTYRGWSAVTLESEPAGTPAAGAPITSQARSAAAVELIQPLTKRNADGQLYERLPDVELQMREAIALDAAALRARLPIADQSAADYLKEETLVYLLRRAYAAADRGLVDDLTATLLGRCTNLVRHHLGSLGPDAVEEGSAEFAADLVTQILDGNRADFLQVRFWVAAPKFAIRVFGRLARARQHQGDTVPFSSIAGYEPDAKDDGRMVSARQLEDVAAPSDEEFVINNALVNDALARINERHRAAFLLRHYAGWPIEDQDPNVPTISRKFGVDPRTIRNWLKAVEDELQSWRGEQER